MERRAAARRIVAAPRPTDLLKGALFGPFAETARVSDRSFCCG